MNQQVFPKNPCVHFSKSMDKSKPEKSSLKISDEEKAMLILIANGTEKQVVEGARNIVMNSNDYNNTDEAQTPLTNPEISSQKCYLYVAQSSERKAKGEEPIVRSITVETFSVLTKDGPKKVNRTDLVTVSQLFCFEYIAGFQNQAFKQF